MLLENLADLTIPINPSPEIIYLLPKCQKCYQTQKIKIKKEGVLVNCKCSNSHITSISDFLQEIIPKPQRKFCQLSSKHPNSPAIQYCIECRYWMCIECKEIHDNCSGHRVSSSHESTIESKNDELEQPFEQYITEKDLTQIQNELNESNKFLDGYYKQIIKNYIADIEMKKSKAEDAYQKGIQKNKDILTIVDILYKTYIQNKNKVNLNNLVNNMSFNRKSKSQNETIIDYYKKFLILDPYKDKSYLIKQYFKQIREIKEQGSKIYSILLLHDGRLAQCSDSTIKIYSLKDNEHKVDLILKGHTDDVTYITETEDNLLVSCSLDYKLRLWRINKNLYQCENVYDSHKESVNKVIYIPKQIIVSCSKDQTVKIWSTSIAYECLNTFKFSYDVQSLCFIHQYKERVIAACYNKEIAFCNVDNYETEDVVKGVDCCSINSICELSEKRLFVGGVNLITLINIENLEIITQINNIQGIHIFATLFINGKVLFGDDVGGIYEFEPNDMDCSKVKTICNGKEEGNFNDINYSINCIIKIKENLIALCSNDQTIKFYEI